MAIATESSPDAAGGTSDPAVTPSPSGEVEDSPWTGSGCAAAGEAEVVSIGAEAADDPEAVDEVDPEDCSGTDPDVESESDPLTVLGSTWESVLPPGPRHMRYGAIGASFGCEISPECFGSDPTGNAEVPTLGWPLVRDDKC